MKISQDVVKNLVKAVRTHGLADDIDGPEGQPIDAYYLEDLSVSFLAGDRPSLYGISFEAIGREFTILPTLELIVTLPQAEGEAEDEAYELDDAEVVAHIEAYLRWRTVALEKFNI